MIVTFQDELGVVSVSVNADGVQFDINKAYFTDENEKDYTVNVEHIISITNSTNEIKSNKTIIDMFADLECELFHLSSDNPELKTIKEIHETINKTMKKYALEWIAEKI